MYTFESQTKTILKMKVLPWGSSSARGISSCIFDADIFIRFKFVGVLNILVKVKFGFSYEKLI